MFNLSPVSMCSFNSQSPLSSREEGRREEEEGEEEGEEEEGEEEEEEAEAGDADNNVEILGIH